MSSGVLADFAVLRFVCRVGWVGQAACEAEGGAALTPFFEWTVDRQLLILVFGKVHQGSHLGHGVLSGVIVTDLVSF